MSSSPAQPPLCFRPTKSILYGRSQEELLLKHCYRRAISAADGSGEYRNEFVLINGLGGTGKTALALTSLRETVMQHGGCMIQVKFDPLDHQMGALKPLVAAVSDLVDFIISDYSKKGTTSLVELYQKLKYAMGPEELGWLTQLVPALGKIVTNDLSSTQPQQQATASQKSASELISRFRHVVGKLVHTVCSRERPIVLFLDDLQWADKEALDLVSSLLLSDEPTEGLVIIGACRSSEITMDADLSVMLRSLEDDHGREVQITNIELKSLSKENICHLIADAFEVDEGSCQHLATVIYNHTNGNIFHTVELVRSLSEAGAIQRCDNGKYLSLVDMASLHSVYTKLSDDAATDLIIARLCKLPPVVQETLAVAACMGTEFNPDLVRMSVKDAPDDLFTLAENIGLITMTKNDPPRYLFPHNKVQQACFTLIAAEDKASFRLSAGRLLWKNLTKLDVVEEHCYLVTQLLKDSLELITDGAERVATAELFLYTGKKAEMASCFHAAASLFASGRSLLPPRHWRDKYELSLELYNVSAEVEQVLGRFDQSELLSAQVLENARSFRDKLPAYISQITALGSSMRWREAVDLGVTVLKLLDVRLRRKTNRIHSLLSFRRSCKLLRQMKVNDILSLPLMTDWDKIAAMRILNLMSTYTYVCDYLYIPMVSMRMIQLTLQHGLSVLSATGFAFHAMLLSVAGQVERGFQFGQVALQLLNKFGVEVWAPRVYVLVYALTNVTMMPLRKSIGPLLDAYRIGLACGDTECATLGAHMHVLFRFFSGESIKTLLPLCVKYRKVFVAYNQENALASHDPLLQTLENLSGNSEEALLLTGTYLNEENALLSAKMQNSTIISAAILFCKMMVAFIMNDYTGCERIYQEQLTMPNTLMPISRCYLYFMGGVSKVLLVRRVGTKRRRRLREARKCLRYLRRQAQYSPENHLHQVYFLEAQLLLVKLEVDQAMTKLQRADEWAEREGFLYDQAIVAEHTGNVLFEQGRTNEGEERIRRAVSYFEQWGAMAKVSQLQSAKKV